MRKNKIIEEINKNLKNLNKSDTYRVLEYSDNLIDKKIKQLTGEEKFVIDSFIEGCFDGSDEELGKTIRSIKNKLGI